MITFIGSRSSPCETRTGNRGDTHNREERRGQPQPNLTTSHHGRLVGRDILEPTKELRRIHSVTLTQLAPPRDQYAAFRHDTDPLGLDRGSRGTSMAGRFIVNLLSTVRRYGHATCSSATNTSDINPKTLPLDDTRHHATHSTRP